MDIRKIKNRLQKQSPMTFEWIKKGIATYGTEEGQHPSFTIQKVSAILWSVFHPGALSLQEVALLSGATYGTLRVWRTQEEFSAQCKTTEEALGIDAFLGIENSYDEPGAFRPHTDKLAREWSFWSEYTKMAFMTELSDKVAQLRAERTPGDTVKATFFGFVADTFIGVELAEGNIDEIIREKWKDLRTYFITILIVSYRELMEENTKEMKKLGAEALETIKRALLNVSEMEDAETKRAIIEAAVDAFVKPLG